MSLSINPLSVVQCLDPRTKLNNKRDYAVYKAGSQSSWKPVITTSYSTNSIQFTCPPPSPGIIVDRRVLLNLKLRLTLNGTTSGGDLYQPGLDAPRAYPISSVISTIAATINNTQVSINMSDVIHALVWYNTSENTRNVSASLCPTMLDQLQEYGSQGAILMTAGTMRSPLNTYQSSESGADLPRGAFPITLVSNSPTQAVIVLNITEALHLSPFLFGGPSECPGFIGLQALDFNLTLDNLSRVWSSVFSVDASHHVDSISVAFESNPQMLFNYITPTELTPIPKASPYPYFEVARYPTNVGSLAALDSTSVSSSNIQLQSIPRRMYVFARERNQDRKFSTTDTFAAISKISINWNNFSGLMSSATQQDLYQMCARNGCNMSWTQWSGFAAPGSATAGLVLGTVGSVLAIDFGSDIGLSDVEAPGLLGTYQLQLTVNLTNPNPTRAINYDLYIVICSEGTFTIMENRAIAQIGVLSKDDILSSRSAPEVSYEMVKAVNGGNFLSKLKDFFIQARDFRDKIKPYVSPVLDQVEKVYKDPRIKAARFLTGLGKKKKAGVLVGGKRVSKSKLASRLADY